MSSRPAPKARRARAAARRARERKKIERLMWRAGFGAGPAELDHHATRGLERTVQHLLEARAPELRSKPGPARVDGAPIDPVNAYGHDVLWWLDRAARTNQPLLERMTFNWHDHFATSNDSVGDTGLMLAQYATLRSGALGRFEDLAKAMTLDGAMQRFLNLSGSHKRAPNENYARELFELFTLGVNNGYTESDVREAARALTGFTHDGRTRTFGYDPRRHDDTPKNILGQVGNWAPLDTVRIAVSHPNHAPYLCAKLWSYFSPRPLPGLLLDKLVRRYRDSGTQIRPVLRAILMSDLFYADLEAPDMVKPPFVYVAGMHRQTATRVEGEHWVWMLEQMAQVPFHPPNVAGWESGPAFLSTSTIKARFDAASRLLGDGPPDGSISRNQSPAAAIRSAMAATGRPRVGPSTTAALERYARTSVAGRHEDWEVRHYYPERQRVLRHLLLAGPDAQVC
ncbi:DUF1800 domain-containing protein [Miltoncostaea oceani]|uniref:DUF1800 domain-containing protein n=1 Tax=Miltoncostaea oceani TaxID=2843216 RepID=UPI001C3CAA99|nr:DUF1800 domain-containing protein [Miltoncostaea oceani]